MKKIWENIKKFFSDLVKTDKERVALFKTKEDKLAISAAEEKRERRRIKGIKNYGNRL